MRTNLWRGKTWRQNPIGGEQPRELGEETRMNLEKARSAWSKISNKP
jgi:hypothetical protein